MTNQEIIQALKDTLVFDAFVVQANKYNQDNLSMLLAIATGKVFKSSQIWEIVDAI